MEENILVFPNRIRFGVDHSGMLIEECITISSAWSRSIAFRIRPSAADVLNLPTTAGYLHPFQSLRIPVKSLRSVNPQSFFISISVDIAESNDKIEKTFPIADLFWTQSMIHHTTRVVSCECLVEHESGIEEENASPKRNSVSPPAAKVHPPRGHVLDLMVKNVSKNDPLTNVEKEELKSIRGLMTREQWNNWLSFARAEKKMRMARNTDTGSSLSSPVSSPPKNSNMFSKSLSSGPSQLLLDNIMKASDTINRASHVSLGARPPASLSNPPKSPNAEKSKSPDRRYDMNEGVAQVNNKLHQPVTTDFKEPAFFSRSKSPPSMIEKNRPSSASKFRTIPARPNSAPRLRGKGAETLPGGISCGTPRRMHETKSSETTGKGKQHSRLGENTPFLSSPASMSSRNVGKGSKPVTDNGLGSSHGSRNSVEDKLAVSNNAPPIQTPFLQDTKPKSPLRTSSLSKSSDASSPFMHDKKVNQPMLGDSENFHQQLFRHSYSKKKNLHPPEVVYKSPPHEVNPPAKNLKFTEDRFSASNFIPDDSSEEMRDNSSVSPTAIAAAKASALRIDSAFAAAECMKASIKADESKLGVEDAHKTATTIAMLDVMMKSLEKSKISLNDILVNDGGDRENVDVNLQNDKAFDDRTIDNSFDYDDSDNEKKRNRLEPKSSKQNSPSGKRNDFGYPTPDMELLRTNELSASNIYSDKSDDDMNFGDYTKDRFRLSSSRLYKSSILDESLERNHDVATRSDFKELLPHNDAEDDNDTQQNPAASFNRNTAAHAVARNKQGKSMPSTRDAIPRVWRICLSQGPLQKAFEENPIRFDVENSTVDIVWRDSRTMMNSSVRGEYSYNSKASTLRRERFHFNESYVGPGGLGKLCSYARQRVKKSIQYGRGIVFVCVAAADDDIKRNALVEPPVSVVLGDSGGQGLISAVVESLFKFSTPRSYPCKQFDQSLHRKYDGKNAPPILASTTNLTEAVNDPVLFSAVVISEGSIIDLLGPSSSLVYLKGSNNPGKKQPKKCKVSRKANGAYYIAHMTRLQLHSASDLERVAGVLLGRRSSLREMVPILEEMLAALPLSEVLEDNIHVPDTPWLLSSKQEATLLFTVSTKSFPSGMPSVHGNPADLNYFFTCPCGDSWSLPGNELCLLSEGISSLPHSPTPSLLQAGVLPQILLDPNAAPLDYVNVAAVTRSGLDSAPRNHNEKNQQCIQNSLQSLRVVTSDS